MTNSKYTKRALLMSVLSIVLCFAMLIGTTFAWFTDTVTSGNNKIVAGNLKIDLEVLEKNASTNTEQWISVKDSNAPIFNYTLWEPGYTEVKVIRVVNEGNLALKWKAMLTASGTLTDLANVIDVYVKEDVTSYVGLNRDSLEDWTKVGTLASFINTIESTTTGEIEPNATRNAYEALGIAFKMQESAGNEYQNMDLGGEFDLKIVATQMQYESDSFGIDYDKDAWLGEADTAWYTDDATTYTVDTAVELAGLAKLVNEGNTFNNITVKLGANIDLWNLSWTPIGISTNSGNYFSGIFDGDGYTISNLNVIAYGEENVGLFGVVAHEAEVKNVTINNATVKGEENVGGLIGLAYSNVTVDNCHVTGNIAIEGNYKVGGLIGGDYFTVKNSSVIGAAVSTYSRSAAATTSYVKGIYKEADLEGDNIGGIAGFVAESSTASAPMDNNTANINVEGTRKVGGIFGSIGANRKVTNCVYTGTVSSNASVEYINDNFAKMFVGGIVGEMTGDGCILTYNTATAVVNGVNANGTGAIVGGTRKSSYDIAQINAANNATTSTVNCNAQINSAENMKAALEAGGNITVVGTIDMSGETLKVMNGTTVSGGAIQNAHLTMADDYSVAFDGVTFDNTTTIEAKGDGGLTFTDCEFNVAPNMYNGFSRGAAIIGANQYYTLDLELEGCTFNYTVGSVDKWNSAIFMWSNVDKCSIKNCTFNDYGFMAVKLMNAVQGAEIVFDGNTFNMCDKDAANYFNNNAVQIMPQHDNAITVKFINNVFTGDYKNGQIVATIEVMHGGKLTDLTFEQSGNTINGEAVTTIDNFAIKAN